MANVKIEVRIATADLAAEKKHIVVRSAEFPLEKYSDDVLAQFVMFASNLWLSCPDLAAVVVRENGVNRVEYVR